MATIVGAITSSHVPAIGRAIAKNLQQDPYWKSFFDGYLPAHASHAKPDVAVIFYNDHGSTFPRQAADLRRRRGTHAPAPTKAGAFQRCSRSQATRLSWHLIESLVADEFDITMCQEMLVDHAATLPMALLWPGGGPWPVRIVPIAMNHVQHPLPSPKRCHALGKAVGRALDAWESDARVVVLGTGGLSHQLDGKRAGFINKPFDLMCMDAMVGDPEKLTHYSTLDIIREAGAQGTELMAWIAARGALTGRVTKVHSNYHVPISNTATGMMVLENEPPMPPQARAA
jgi:protocatechuate 4,5-dioxygenase beta chain